MSRSAAIGAGFICRLFKFIATSVIAEVVAVSVNMVELCAFSSNCLFLCPLAIALNELCTVCCAGCIVVICYISKFVSVLCCTF